MKHIFCLLLVGCTAITHAQQAPTAYTLATCLQKGIENNLSIKIIKNNEQIAANNTTRSNAGMTPTADLQGGYTANLLSTQTTSRDGIKTSQTSSINHAMNASVGLDWTIFDGFGMQTNYAKLKELRSQGQIRTRLALEELISDITTEYYNYVQQHIRLQNYRYAVRLSRERLRIAEERFHVGKGSGLEYQQASVDFNADSSQYIRQHELVETSKINLNRLMNINDIDQQIDVSDTLIQVNEKLHLPELTEAMNQNNASLLLAKSDERLSLSDLKLTQTSNYPYLKLNTGYGYTNHIYSKGSSKRNGSWGPEVGVTVSFSLFDKNIARRQRNAKIEVENATLEKQQLQLNLKADLNNLWQAYQNNLKVLHLERENLRVAYNNYEIARDRYLLGDLPGIDMREAQKSLLDANERILTAEYSTKVCEISLMLISGQIQHYMQ